jgi:DNA topoisomerase-1
LVRRCQELPGQVLFQYIDDDEQPRPLSSTEVNDYLRAVAGQDVTAKDFRTWKASVMAAAELASYAVPNSEREARSAIKEVAAFVSEQLRNTPAISRASYIHPALFAAHRRGDLPELWQRASTRGPRLLLPDERRLLHVLPELERERAA